ncbi:MAG: alpha/beta hydrolase [Actinobacteria bacterium]|nr:alpha/beta hydrolase [Actinomycetota bacterium]
MAHRLQVGNVQVEYTDDEGGGDAILFVHGGLFSEWFRPVAGQESLAGNRVIVMRRAGYVRAADATEPLSVTERAAHCADVLEHLSVERAHVCGHSSGAIISLQLALDRSDLVQSLILLEPAPVGGLCAPSAMPVIEGPMAESMMKFAGDDVAGGFDLFMRATCAPDYETVIEEALGAGASVRAVEESRAFPDEARACSEWVFGDEEAARLEMPVLAVTGGATARDCPLAPDSVELLARLVPQTETTVLADANHLMPIADPAGVGSLAASFAARHPVAAVVGPEA